jgi:phage terminase small subunit
MPTPLKPIEVLEAQHGKLYGEQADRARNTPMPAGRMEPLCPKDLTREAKAAWRYMAAILKNWGLFNAANGPHLELFAVNWSYYRHYQQKAWEFEANRNPDDDPPKRNGYLGQMNTFEGKVRHNLADMGVGTMGLAKVGQALAHKRKRNEIEELMD